MKKINLLLLVLLIGNLSNAQTSFGIDEFIESYGGGKITGQSYDGIGRIISTGDINGDGYSDILLGLTNGNASEIFYGGFYLIFGQKEGFLDEVDLSNFRDFGIKVLGKEDQYFYNTGLIEDLNQDGFDELYINVFESFEEDSLREYSVTYIVYGKENFVYEDFNLEDLNENEFFTFSWEKTWGNSGTEVRTGDINHDGFVDIILLATGATYLNNYDDFGAAYIVFGQESGSFENLKDEDLDGENGFIFRIHNANSSNRHRMKMVVGDISGDNIEDILITHPHLDTSEEESGQLYILFGRQDGFNSVISISDLNGQNGISLMENRKNQGMGYSPVIGDFNGDGRGDFVVGGPTHSGNQWKGAIYLVSSIELDTPTPNLVRSFISSNGGVYVTASNNGEKQGFSTTLTNYNGDIYDDLVFSARERSSNTLTKNGSVYIVFGKPSFSSVKINDWLVDDAYIELNGIEENEHLGSVVTYGDVNGDGLDEIIVGTQDDYVDPTSDFEENGWVYVLNGAKIRTQVNNESNEELFSFDLLQNYPNPFNPSTKINFLITNAGVVNLSIYDLLGKRVEILVNEFKNVGEYEVEWNAANIPSGIYYYKLEFDGQSIIKRMALIK